MFQQCAEKVFTSILGKQQIFAQVTDRVSPFGRWVSSESQRGRGIFHLIDSGACCVETVCLRESVELSEGDLIVFPRGGVHALRHATRGATASEAPSGEVALLCGEFSFDGGERNPLFAALPDCFVVREAEGATPFRALGAMLVAELRAPMFGNQVVVNKLADSLLVLAIRSHLVNEVPRHGLLAALNDPRLILALAAIHDDPGRDWSVADLAQAANLSRTSFCDHFSRVLGTTPMLYLTQWRMSEALRLLRDPGQTVARVSERLGYQTDAAFRRAFKRVHGFAPGKIRGEVALAAM